MCSSNDLPPDLEAKALKQFDILLSKGEILYEPSRTSIRWAQGFEVCGGLFIVDDDADAVGSLLISHAVPIRPYNGLEQEASTLTR